MEQTEHKKKRVPMQLILPIGIVLIIIIVGIVIISTFSGDNAVTQDNVKKLEELEKKDVSEIEAEMKEKAAEATTISEEELKNLKEYSTAELAEHYQGTVIVGDSITDSIVGYELLGRDVVVSKIGLSVAKADEQIQTAIGLNPSNIILCFGANDLETYIEDSTRFITEYTKQIRKIEKALPGTKIFINSIFPIEESRVKATPALAYYPDYNTKLQEMCTTLGLTYIDSTFLVTQNPDYYEPDGEHLVYAFYPKWLTYMAIKAGL